MIIPIIDLINTLLQHLEDTASYAQLLLFLNVYGGLSSKVTQID